MNTGTKMLFVAIILCLSTTVPAACPPQRNDLNARVDFVLDGDTVRLVDGTHVRLIGINTPEMGRNRPAEPFAEQASQALKTLLRQTGNKVILQYGVERFDHYGRTLAHVFLSNGLNVSEVLAKKGLALRIAIPPNLWGQDCYRQAEDDARNKRLGLWSIPVIHAPDLPHMSKGFFLIQGRIKRIGKSRKSIWLNFDGNLSIRVARKDLAAFDNVNLTALRNHYLRVRGWVHNYRGENIMRLRHSSMLEIMK